MTIRIRANPNERIWSAAEIEAIAPRLEKLLAYRRQLVEQRYKRDAPEIE